MKLVLQNDYPSSPPRGFFLTKIFHPNVSNNGDICVNTLKRDWKPEVTLAHIFQVIRCLLIIPFPESSLNDEAGKLFMESFDEFAKRAKIMTKVHAIPVAPVTGAGAGATTDAEEHECEHARCDSSSSSVVVASGKCVVKAATTFSASENDGNSCNTNTNAQQQGASSGLPSTVFNVVDSNVAPISKAASAGSKSKTKSGDLTAAAGASAIGKKIAAVGSSTTATSKDAKKKTLKRL